MKNLDPKIKVNFLDQGQSENQLNKICQDQKSKKLNYKLLFGAATVVALVLGVFWAFLVQPSINKNKIVFAYATEIALNHKRQLPMEIVSTDTKVLNASLENLNFDISYDETLQGFGILVGGRYCKVNNQLAAKLKIVDRENKTLTCYQFVQQHKVSFDEKLNYKGTNVHLWTQDSLVFAVARTNDK